ncbi:hypothetical protein ACT009_09815 [Sphingomonas sp. Tas61C01]|uniref:hypothetical protein n=1 Tax=Sphingomonas sp. Tas61C01 TaxID=3458297 RepID=UPI00403E85EB
MRPPLYLAIAAVVASQGGGAVGAEGGEAEAAPVFLLPMAPLDVPIVEGDRSDGRLRLKLVLRAADAADLERLRGALPALRETTLATASEFARLYATPFAPVNARLLARDMTEALRGRDATISAVLLVEVAAVRA